MHLLAQVNAKLAEHAESLDVEEPSIRWMRPKSEVPDWSVEIITRGWSRALYARVDHDRQFLEEIAQDVVTWPTHSAMRRAVRGIAQGDVDAIVDTLKLYLRGHFDEQIHLAAVGRRLGMRRPAGDRQHGHLHMDRLVHAHIARLDALRAVVRLCPANADQGIVTAPSVGRVQFSEELLEGIPPLPMLLVALPLDGLPTGATFDGIALELPGVELPDTTMTAAVGRPLRDLAETIPGLADRVITRVEGWQDSPGARPVLRIWLTPDAVPAMPERAS